MQKICRQCATKFEISDADLKFYEKISPVFGGKKIQVPAPTLCSDCRQQRRMAWRNERKLYHRTCDLSGKSIISNFGPHTPVKVYEQNEWWSDKWDPLSYGREFDYSRSFFEQYQELQQQVPQLALSVWNSENSTFCNYVGNVKNSYLIFGSVYSEDCYYGSPYYSKDCVDTLVVRECQNCYECVDCRKLYECFYCQDCHSSNGLFYCFDVQSSHDCIGCTGLRNKQYYIFNQPFTKEKYEEFKKKLDLCDPKTHQKIYQEMQALKLKIPHRFMQSKNTENVSGNYIYQCKNVHHSFYADRSEDAKYCAQVVDLKDCYDNNYTEENELCLEYLGAYQNNRTFFSKFCNKVFDCFYSDSCFHSKHLFGCIGLRNKEYCILNKQYTKEEYEQIVPKIIAHISSRGEFGEFFPIAISPFCYNETVACEYFPLTREQALKLGWKWKDEDALNRYQGPKNNFPQRISDVQDEILKNILTCDRCNRNYKIIEQELKFYRKMKLPVPRACPDCRYNMRLSMRNPRKLWARACMKCATPVQTTYAPERKEIVYCEKCYLKEVY